MDNEWHKDISDIDFVVLFRYGTTKRSHSLEYMSFAKMSSFAMYTPTIFSFALFLWIIYVYVLLIVPNALYLVLIEHEENVIAVRYCDTRRPTS